LIVFLGVQPGFLVRWSEPTTKAIVAAIPPLEKTINTQVALNN
jgi:NAD(P)H-quinone oxidoreductase subunit 4